MKTPTLALLLSSSLLCACSSTAPPSASATDSDKAPAKPDTATQIGQAVISPLGDLNLVKADIPPVLRTAAAAPYAAPADASCRGIGAEVEALNKVLGADLDVPATPSNPSLLERSRSEGSSAAVDAVRGAAEGVVPFRGWVRKLTGAERYSKEVIAAITAGTVRRSYLKGLGQAAGCAAPASPASGVAALTLDRASAH